MDKDKIKLIIRNMELLLDSLKAEVYSDSPSHSNHTKPEITKRPVLDYDEIFDDDGYID